MTEKDTAKASPDATPKEGEVLLYIDWQGNKIYGKPAVDHKQKTGAKDK
jgi:hypothetical protein